MRGAESKNPRPMNLEAHGAGQGPRKGESEVDFPMAARSVD